MSNTWVICPGDGNSTWKHVVMPDTTACTEVRAGKGATAPPRDEPAAQTMGSRPERVDGHIGIENGPDSYGRQQLRIFHNGRKSDGATPRERRRP